MKLARVYPIVDSAAWVKRLAPLGVRLVQLRIKEQPHETLEQGQRGQHQLRGPVWFRGLQPIHQLPARTRQEPAGGDRAAQRISADALVRDAVVGFERRRGVEVEPVHARVEPRLGGFALGISG